MYDATTIALVQCMRRGYVLQESSSFVRTRGDESNEGEEKVDNMEEENDKRKRMTVVRKIMKLKSSAAPKIRSAIGYWPIICIV